ncbi:transferase [Desulfobacterales bacterium HSG17]|nr:transferase [Desulfobacterales bacterium HSG17]
MKQLEKLFERIVSRTKINLRELDFNLDDYVEDLLPLEQLVKFYSFYGITSHHPIHFSFKNSNLAGSYFLGTCSVLNSILYKSDIRGDELKLEGETFKFQDTEIILDVDEMISIKNSMLIKTLVHNFSHDPEKIDLFLIKNTISSPYANIHGAPMDGCFLGPFSTVDLTTLHNCVIGTYSFVQVGRLSHTNVPSGQVWVKSGDVFDFKYQFPLEELKHYITLKPGEGAVGRFIDFAEDRKTEFQRLYDVVHLESPIAVPLGASINRYSVFLGQSHIEENVLVAQRAFIESSHLGKGANAQENCYISNSRLEGYNVTAHGATIIHALLDKKVFVGFNSFIQGKTDCKLTVGAGSVIMPHTIIHLNAPLEIPPGSLVWGYIRNAEDLANNSISLDRLSKVKDKVEIGNMRFTGDGSAFVHAFQHRVEHILEANGAYFDGELNRGHAQMGQNISFNIIQPYSRGSLEGLYPSIEIQP